MLYFIIILINLVIDIQSKKWILNHILVYKKIHVVSFINLTHVHNYGIIFGFLSHIPQWETWILFFINISIIWLILKKMRLQPQYINKKIKIVYSFIIGGALGNLYDRIYHGFVIDFIELKFNTNNLITFNIADSCIFIGIMFIIIYCLIILKKIN